MTVSSLLAKGQGPLMRKTHDWDEVAALERQLGREEGLELTPEVSELLRRVARDVVVPDAEVHRALMTRSGSVELVREVRRRIREGSQRLMRAISESNRLVESGDMPGARQCLEDVLAVEVVPLYRQHAEAELSHLE
ncbi:DUSAM domain-containing protein [Corallococcus macrosporus]|uniref:DUSAM domain-containing protein n=1 Tax=Corallococcus macrosporus TaxID=35 RepID=UPI001EE641E6|nr:DUSAM domain-containing protein [Corallococcus macrosporus]